MKKKERDWNFELLRIITMLMVVFIHAIEYGKIFEMIDAQSFQYYLYYFLHSLCRVGVNCFVLISGYYLVYSKSFVNRFLKILIQTIFYSFVFYLILVMLGEYDLEWKMVRVYLTPIGHEVYWYVTRYTFLLVFIPFLNILIENINLKYFKFFVILLFVFFSIFPFLFNGATYLTVHTGKEFSLFILLYCLGAYIRKRDIKKSSISCICKYILLILIGMILVLSADKIHIDISNNRILRYNSPLIIIASYYIFIGFKNINKKTNTKISTKLTMWIQNIGPLTFGVYLLHNHPLIRNYIWHYILPNYVYLFLYVLLVFMVCVGIEYIRKKLFFKIDECTFHFSKYLEKKLDNVIRKDVIL